MNAPSPSFPLAGLAGALLALSGAGCFPFPIPDDPTPGADETFRLQTEHHGARRCLESGDGTQGIYMAQCGYYSGQIWEAVAVKEALGYYELKSEYQGEDRCLDGNDPDSSVLSGAAFMAPCSDSSSQRWRFVPDGDAVLMQTEFHGGNECLDANRIGELDHNGQGFMAACASLDSQRWFRPSAQVDLDLGLIRREVVETSETHPSGTSTIEVSCPPGKVVTGGGAIWDGTQVVLSESRAANPTTWRVSGVALFSSQWSIHAVCVDEASAAGYQIVEASGVHPNGGQWQEVACPGGTRVVGGGGVWDPAIRLDNNRPPDDSRWGIAGYSEQNGSWTAQAICVEADSLPGYGITTNVGTHPTGPDASIVASCPSGVSLSGGGYWDASRIALGTSRPSGATGWELRGGADTSAEWWAVTVCAAAE